MTLLTPNFSLKEMTKSNTARNYGFSEQYAPPPNVVANLKHLCYHFLQPIRNEIGTVIVTSGYRCKRVNSHRDVRGSSTSDHLYGRAADITTPSGCGILVTLLNDWRVRGIIHPSMNQIIYEYGTPKSPEWVHIAWSPSPRGEWKRKTAQGYSFL